MFENYRLSFISMRCSLFLNISICFSLPNPLFYVISMLSLNRVRCSRPSFPSDVVCAYSDIHSAKAGASATNTDEYADFHLWSSGDRMDGTVWGSSEFDTMPPDPRQRHIDSIAIGNRAERSLAMESSSLQAPLSPPTQPPPTIATTTIEPDNVTYSDDNATIANYPQNDTCVGAPEYCNYTREEYIKMLYDYIFPTTGEWILIGCHFTVFVIGLVSNRVNECLVTTAISKTLLAHSACYVPVGFLLFRTSNDNGG